MRASSLRLIENQCIVDWYGYGPHLMPAIKGTLGPPHKGKTSSQMPTLLRVLSLFEPDGTFRKVALLYFSYFRQFLIYFSSCTACAALDDAPAMFCLSLKKAAEMQKILRNYE